MMLRTLHCPVPSVARGLIPGLALCAGVSAIALVVEHLEVVAVGQSWLEALVLAIVLGTLIRTVRPPSARFDPGIAYAAKTCLEAAVALMGVTVSFQAVAEAGVPLVTGIVAVVFIAIAASYGLGRVIGLPRKMALLVACGNAICGNSAIAAVAPVIKARSEDVAASIAFTAVLGVAVVLIMPVLAHGLGLTPIAGGALAGLTVYAVPQVIAAAGPMGALAVQIGTLVKLIRVLMLGPVVAIVSVVVGQGGQRKDLGLGEGRPDGRSTDLLRFVPWFIVVFLLFATLHSLGAVPAEVILPAHTLSTLLTILSMAGLGLGVDLRCVTAAGPRIVAVVVISLIFLTLMALGLLQIVGLA